MASINFTVGRSRAVQQRSESRRQVANKYSRRDLNEVYAFSAKCAGCGAEKNLVRPALAALKQAGVLTYGELLNHTFCCGVVGTDVVWLAPPGDSKRSARHPRESAYFFLGCFDAGALSSAVVLPSRAKRSPLMKL